MADVDRLIRSDIQDAADDLPTTPAIQHAQDSATFAGAYEPPASNLHLQRMALEPDYGREIPSQLYDKLQKIHGDKYESLWEQLAFYNKSMRLGNLNSTEMDYVRWHLTMCAHCLRWGLIESFMLYLGEAANVIETSHNKAGWLRQLFNKQFVEISRKSGQEKRGMMGNIKEE